MLIRLEHDGRIVEEISSNNISGELTIGRSTKCTWTVPREDTVISGQHARVFLKRKAVWFKDLDSKNGSFFQGKRISDRKLRSNDRISLGNCTLLVEREDAGGPVGAAPEIVVRSGKSRGQKKQIQPPAFTVGTDPGSSLVLLDTLVSRNHAEITVKEDGSCWIRDLESKNGTSVNGLPLREDKERMLKDNDVISIAHLEIEFHDGTSRHTSTQAWKRMGIMGATLVLAMGSYWTCQRMRPSAEHFTAQTRKLAAAEDFAAAGKALTKATGARNLASHHLEIEELRRLLGLWESTVGLWQRAQSSLNKGRWIDASRDLGTLQASKKEAWSWSTTALQEKEKASQAKEMLDALLSSKAEIRREDVNVPELRKNQDAVDGSLSALAESCPPYLQKLKEDLMEVHDDVARVIKEGSGLEEALDKLKKDAPAFEEITAAIDNVRKNAGGSLRRKAELVHGAVAALGRSDAARNKCAALARELKLRDAMAIELDLPSIDMCAADSRVSKARAALESRFANMKTTVAQLSYLYEQISKLVKGSDANAVDSFKQWQNADLMGKVFACDAIENQLPRRSRNTPSGEYDRMLGVEEFYYVLSVMPDRPDPMFIEQMPIPTVLTSCRELAKRIARLKEFLNNPDNKWLVYGQLSQTLAQFETVLNERDAVVQLMMQTAKNSSGRKALTAGGIAVVLAAKPGDLSIDDTALQDWVAGKLKEVRAELLKLNTEYTAASPVRQIAIRNQILERGLPGDPVVRRMWASRDAARGL